MTTRIPEVLKRPVCDETLKFNEKYLGPILSGEKVQTIRIKQKDIPKFSTVKAVFTDSDYVLKLFITHRGGKLFKDLTKIDAYREGYNNLESLKRELIDIYPKIHRYTPLYYYGFKVVG